MTSELEVCKLTTASNFLPAFPISISRLFQQSSHALIFLTSSYRPGALCVLMKDAIMPTMMQVFSRSVLVHRERNSLILPSLRKLILSTS